MLLVASGVSVLRVLELEDDTHALVESVLDAPGRYPFSVRIDSLVPTSDA
ncbi:hypothetical protein ABZ894_26065 [Nocardia beijingensis]